MSPTPSKSVKRPLWKRRLFWFFVLIGLVLLGSINSGRSARPSARSSSVTAPILTKMDWKRKAASISRLVGGQLIAETEPFVGLMGAPNRTQAVQGKAIWYYVCADGKIQLVMFGDPSSGTIIADINEY